MPNANGFPEFWGRSKTTENKKLHLWVDCISWVQTTCGCMLSNPNHVEKVEGEEDQRCPECLAGGPEHIERWE